MKDEKIDRLKKLLPVKITGIAPQKKRKDRFSLFHNDTFLIGISGGTLLSQNIQKETVLTSQLLNQILDDEEYQSVKDACYRYLSRRDHAAMELRQKITQKGLRASVADLIIEEFEQKGLIDDYRFAKKFAADKMELKKWGPLKIKNALLRKGVKKSISEKVTQNIIENLEQDGICVDLLRKRKAHFLRETDPMKRRQKMYRYLAGKGFYNREINDAINRVKSEFDVK
ncbi:regulatory protein RecX [Rhodohalobacter mucosus]|uniref:Regulatory protein RecX n=1 Tax=Rhodohalobacter mucosus TaxID=2079485 RepID=A0A316TQ82_9BACT|nr:regulatory protein RecX [Rhodohalobacter mucosus]PWN05165.1 hypothetical protein DDZ15_15690 [Rhodohalobacter mucosus]